MNERDTRGNRPQVLLSWSSGKDSAWALHVLRSEARFDVRGLITTTNEDAERVAMHGVRERLLEAQARAVGLPVRIVPLPAECSNDEYEARLARALLEEKERGIGGVAFGDLFLEDVRRYRERHTRSVGLEPHFPLWGSDTKELSGEMVASGVRARLTCVDPLNCPAEFAGREYDSRLFADLPDDVDPCGENGEFHTFAWDGPAFAHPVPVECGQVVERGGFVFCDLLPREDRP